MLIDFPLALVKKLLQLWLLQIKNFARGIKFSVKVKKWYFVPQSASVFNVISQLYLIVMVDFG